MFNLTNFQPTATAAGPALTAAGRGRASLPARLLVNNNNPSLNSTFSTSNGMAASPSSLESLLSIALAEVAATSTAPFTLTSTNTPAENCLSSSLPQTKVIGTFQQQVAEFTSSAANLTMPKTSQMQLHTPPELDSVAGTMALDLAFDLSAELSHPPATTTQNINQSLMTILEDSNPFPQSAGSPFLLHQRLSSSSMPHSPPPSNGSRNGSFSSNSGSGHGSPSNSFLSQASSSPMMLMNLQQQQPMLMPDLTMSPSPSFYPAHQQQHMPRQRAESISHFPQNNGQLHQQLQHSQSMNGINSSPLMRQTASPSFINPQQLQQPQMMFSRQFNIPELQGNGHLHQRTMSLPHIFPMQANSTSNGINSAFMSFGSQSIQNSPTMYPQQFVPQQRYPFQSGNGEALKNIPISPSKTFKQAGGGGRRKSTLSTTRDHYGVSKSPAPVRRRKASTIAAASLSQLSGLGIVSEIGTGSILEEGLTQTTLEAGPPVEDIFIPMVKEETFVAVKSTSASPPPSASTSPAPVPAPAASTSSASTSETTLPTVVEKPVITEYRCDHEGCNSVFTRPQNLRSHSRCHLTFAPHCCTEPGCDLSFKRTTDLARHQKTMHLPESERPFGCQHEGCPRRFGRSDGMKRHMTTCGKGKQEASPVTSEKSEGDKTKGDVEMLL